jgi:hypothetical protein
MRVLGFYPYVGHRRTHKLSRKLVSSSEQVTASDRDVASSLVARDRYRPDGGGQTFYSWPDSRRHSSNTIAVCRDATRPRTTLGKSGRHKA